VIKGVKKYRRIDLSIRKHDKKEERQLLKRYRNVAEGTSLGDVTGWGEADPEEGAPSAVEQTGASPVGPADGGTSPSSTL